MVTAVAVQNDLVFVTSVESQRERIQILRATSDWSGAYVLLGEIIFDFTNFAHQSYGLAVRSAPNDPAVTETLLQHSAPVVTTQQVGTPQSSGLLETSLPDAGLYVTPGIGDRKGADDLPNRSRSPPDCGNAMAFGFHPETGDLWITDNGIDGFEDVWSSYSADELNVIRPPRSEARSRIGFPYTYTLYATGEVVGSGGIQPVVAFVPLGGAENEGVASLAFIPASFASGFGHGVVVGFHGQYDMWGPANEENALLFVDLATLTVSTLVAPGSPGVGHLDSLAAGENAIFVADMCDGSSLAVSQPCGTIYRLEIA